jgi:hypothetical protein
MVSHLSFHAHYSRLRSWCWVVCLLAKMRQNWKSQLESKPSSVIYDKDGQVLVDLGLKNVN